MFNVCSLRRTSFRRLGCLAAILVALCSFPVQAFDEVVIDALDDMDLGVWTGASELSDQSVHCVAATKKYYSITATGDGMGGAFTVSNGDADIPFQVYYKEKQNANLIQLTAGSPVHNLKGRKLKKKKKKKDHGHDDDHDDDDEHDDDDDHDDHDDDDDDYQRQSCKNGKQVVEVRMLGVDMAKVPAGAYSGTLNLMVTPQ